jgi:hypothetical protein
MGAPSLSRRVSAAIVAMVCLLLPSAGCSVIKASRQPDKKNLTVLSPGVPRTHVIAELGPPTFTEEREGRPTDVFVFKQGYTKTAKAGRALVHGAADVATWGVWEVVGTPFEMLADGTNVKVEVHYDENRFVSGVTFFEGEKVMQPRQGFFARLRRKPNPATPLAPARGGETGPMDGGNMDSAGEAQTASRTPTTR